MENTKKAEKVYVNLTYWTVMQHAPTFNTEEI